MVPLAFFNGWPVVGCICADGSYSSNCSMLQDSTTEGASVPCCCAVACGATPEGDKPTPQCCQTTADFPADTMESRADDESRCVVKHKGCCHIVVQAGELPTLLLPVLVADDHQSFAPPVALVWEGVNLSLASGFASFVDDDTGQHPSDLVITLRRLVI